MTGTLYEEKIRTQTQREGLVKTQGKDGHLQGKERGFRRNQPGRHVELELLSGLQNFEKINVCVLGYQSLWDFKN